MSRQDNSSGGKTYSGRQGGGERKKSPSTRGNSPVRSESSSDFNKKGSTRRNSSPATKSDAKPAVKKDNGIRLNKYLSNSGVCSRRDADIYIAAGNVTVNGKPITEMGYKVQPGDEVKFDGQKLNPEKPEYILLNKPRGFYTTGSTEKGSKTVMDLISNATKSKVVPVGKLDRQASGLLLFTNDGTLEKQLGKPKNGIRQIYHVELTKPVSPEDLDKIRDGVTLEDGKVKVQDVSFIDGRPKNEVGIETNSVKQHVVQRLFKSLGYEVEKLDRVVFGGLTKKDLPRGNWRVLTKQELINIKML
ncbi:rRNA pseudouridine synthase [Antarcticibacterium sp. 1MA-6-2]|uniref:pseudouridine synthase n=1 Tax=Antarcticibacterium sp. 1MA-6-2 TaxID=2908210 RepID=UPI001F18EBFD|nr:pseudouridine synthase [Antarcticibacterium sp. 1MA-6-2]UJH89908.1 rRNA pseudouridine synthase [Antarcticibacterium sp. 1MA-6-2]